MSGLPNWAVVPSADLVDGGKRGARTRRVLVLARLTANLRRRLKDRGAELEELFDLQSAAEALAERDHHAVLVELNIPGAAGLVKWIKYDAWLNDVGAPPRRAHVFDEWLDRQQGALDVALPVAAAARDRHRRTPFFLSLENRQEYGVVVAWPEHSYLETGSGISLPDAVMTLDVAKLLSRGSAMA